MCMMCVLDDYYRTKITVKELKDELNENYSDEIDDYLVTCSAVDVDSDSIETKCKFCYTGYYDDNNKSLKFYIDYENYVLVKKEKYNKLIERVKELENQNKELIDKLNKGD